MLLILAVEVAVLIRLLTYRAGLVGLVAVVKVAQLWVLHRTPGQAVALTPEEEVEVAQCSAVAVVAVVLG
jgi:hypothetical protein